MPSPWITFVPPTYYSTKLMILMATADRRLALSHENYVLHFNAGMGIQKTVDGLLLSSRRDKILLSESLGIGCHFVGTKHTTVDE